MVFNKLIKTVAIFIGIGSVTIFDFFKKMEKAREIREKDSLEAAKRVLFKICPELEHVKDKMTYKFSDSQLQEIKALSSENLEAIKDNKLANLDTEKGPKDIFFHFFGMDENWKLGRNLIGGFLVHLPEYPTYFIPSFTQSKTTGDAEDLKKGEGVRGILTGALEGISVGALVSGKKLKPKEMVPYICLGTALQLFSSKVFPFLGEKAGKYYYNKNQEATLKPDNPTQLGISQPASSINTLKQPNFGIYNKTSIRSNTGLKI